MATESKKRAIPKGGRKGGTTFPHLELKQAIKFNKKLVSKTHTTSQPAKIILKGVFNNSGPVGGVRGRTCAPAAASGGATASGMDSPSWPCLVWTGRSPPRARSPAGR